ncbi:MAG: hypothetical protein LQ338_002996 [Usnochroma carphineum]|nr:MAG: hypothetical protein LQ338_002996 [Usnochroma carphineum]
MEYSVPKLTGSSMHDVSPVTDRGSSDADMSAQERAKTTLKARIRQEEMMITRWAQLWRKITLSAIGKTLFPYAGYIRILNLGDLEELLGDAKFKDQVSTMFFEGELGKYRAETSGPRKNQVRLDAGSTSNKLGEIITTSTPMLEELSGKIENDALLRWIPRLPRLRLLNLWYGEALVGVGPLLRQHCHDFKTLSLWGWSHAAADSKFADFLNEITPQTLESLEIFSYMAIGAESLLALSCHRETLTELKLDYVNAEALQSLNLLAGCTNLRTLLLTDGTYRQVNLKDDHNDVFLETIAWLRRCKKLRSVTIRSIRGGQDLVTPILLENDIHLNNLELKGYIMADARDFHQALSNQPSLQELQLQGDSDEAGDGVAILVESLSQLSNLTDLRLQDVSDYFTDEVIGRLARSLPKLEGWWTSGWGVTDGIWRDVAKLKSLRRLDMAALSRFTANGILDFVLNLGPGNKGLVLAIMMADVDCDLSEEEQNTIRETMAARVDGRFEFQLQRATTALTAQNTQGVSDIHYIPSAFVAKQIDACIDDIGVDVAKIVDAVASALEKHGRPTGAQLLPPEAVTNLREKLLPLATILTPNIPEAKLLLDNAGIQYPEIQRPQDIVRIASLLKGLGPKYVLLKGGHIPFNEDWQIAQTAESRKWVTDVLCSSNPQDCATFEMKYSASKNTHGTGCSLASAVASNLALGHDVPSAVEKACRFVERGIKTAPDLGKGSGPINHFHSLGVKEVEELYEESSLVRRPWEWD